MDEKNYAKILPEDPPKAFIDWTVKKEPRMRMEAIFYSLCYPRDPLTGIRSKAVKCHCTACGGEYIETYVQGAACAGYGEPYGYFDEISRSHVSTGSAVMCELCGAQAKAVRATSFSNRYELGYAFPTMVKVIEGNVCFITWYVDKSVDREGKTYITAREWEAYVFTGKKCVKVMGYTRCMSSCSFHSWEQRSRCVDDFGAPKLLYPFDKRAIERSCLKNCKLREYLRDGGSRALPVTYLRYFQKHPCVENLVVQGASSLLTEIFAGASVSYGYYRQDHHYTLDTKCIDWKKRKPHEMLGLTKIEFEMIRRNKWDLRTLEFYKKTKEKGLGLAESDVALCVEFGLFDIGVLYNIPRTFMRMVRYLLKQRAKVRDKTLINARYYADYYDLVVANGGDFSDDAVAFPRSIVNAHDAALRQKEERVNAELSTKFKARYDVLSRFSYRSDCGLEIFPASSQADLIREGKTLHHCVGGYANSHANGDTAIFFIRRTDAPDEPFYTLELGEKTGHVRQNRGKCNCSRTEQVQAFEDEWVAYVKEILEKEGKKKNGRKKRTTVA